MMKKTCCTLVEHRSGPSNQGDMECMDSISSYTLGSLLSALPVAGLSRQMSAPYHLRCVRSGVTYFLFGLQALNDGSELRKDFISLLVVLNLG